MNNVTLVMLICSTMISAYVHRVSKSNFRQGSRAGSRLFCSDWQGVGSDRSNLRRPARPSRDGEDGGERQFPRIRRDSSSSSSSPGGRDFSFQRPSRDPSREDKREFSRPQRSDSETRSSGSGSGRNAFEDRTPRGGQREREFGPRVGSLGNSRQGREPRSSDSQRQRQGGDRRLGGSRPPSSFGRPNFDRGNRLSERPSYSRKLDENGEERIKPYGEYNGDHLYGISPIRAALLANRRNISELIVQDNLDIKNRAGSGSSYILSRVKELGIETREFPKHDLNMMADNRPHQGFILRAKPLDFKRLHGGMDCTEKAPCILALDEVWDPQNFGALLRTAHFLQCDGVVVCSKNSAPLSPAVSKVSSGAMESMEVNSVENMMKFLDKSIENGWQVVGASLDDEAVSVNDIPLDKPTIVVLGNEGHGIRKNVLHRCTHLVKIAGGGDEGSSVDSLNVSVTGGILLHHFMMKK